MENNEYTKIALLEQKMEVFIQSVSKIEEMVAELTRIVKTEYLQEIIEIKAKQVNHENDIKRIEKRITWIIGAVRGFLSLVGLSVLGAILKLVVI